MPVEATPRQAAPDLDGTAVWTPTAPRPQAQPGPPRPRESPLTCSAVAGSRHAITLACARLAGTGWLAAISTHARWRLPSSRPRKEFWHHTIAYRSLTNMPLMAASPSDGGTHSKIPGLLSSGDGVDSRARHQAVRAGPAHAARWPTHPHRATRYHPRRRPSADSRVRTGGLRQDQWRRPRSCDYSLSD